MTAYTETAPKSIRVTSKGKTVNLFPTQPRNRVAASTARLLRWARAHHGTLVRTPAVAPCGGCGEPTPSRYLNGGVCPECNSGLW